MSHAEDKIEMDTNEEIGFDPSKVTKEVIELPLEASGKLAFVLHNVYTKKECDDYIMKTENMGYEAAMINIGCGRQKLMTDYRNSSRCIWDSEIEAHKMWERIKPHIPEYFHRHKVVGLNERLRFLKYDPGEYFKPHHDGNYIRDNGEISYVTVHLYLNEGFQGGSTTFIGKSKRVECVPKTGSILIFQHNIYHEGSTLEKGRKYTVRTDVMYSPCR